MATETVQPAALRAIEVRSIDWVPENERHGRIWHQAPLWFLGNFQYFSIPIGFVGPALGLSLGWSIVAGALGILTGTVFMAFHGAQGPTFALLFTYMAFNVADQVLLAEGMHGAYGWSADLVAVVASAGAGLLAIYGHDWVHRMFRILLLISFPLMTIVSLGVLFGAAGGHAPAHPLGFSTTAFFAQFSAGAAYNITYAPYVSDYSRYLPRETTNRSIIASVFFGASGSAIWLIAIGAWLATRLGATDALLSLRDAGDNVFGGLGTILAFTSVAILVATMGMNAYGGMLTTVTAIDAFRKVSPTRMIRIVTIIALTILWAVVSLSISAGAVDVLFTTLIMMLYLLAPWTAVNLVDYFFVRRGRYAITELFVVDGLYDTWGWRGISAFLLGFAASIPFWVLPGIWTAPVGNALQGVDVAWLVGLVVSGASYFIFSRSLDLGAESHKVRASEQALEGDAAGAPSV